MAEIGSLGERNLFEIIVNGEKIAPESVKKVYLPIGDKPFWEINLKNDETINVTGNIKIRYK